MQRIQHGESADAVGDEVWSVFRAHHTFAQSQVASFVELLQHFRFGFWSRNQFDQLHVARRIEEMRTGPMFLKILGAAFGDEMNWKSGGIGSDDRAGLAWGLDARQEIAFDLEILGDNFDYPVRFRTPSEIVLKIASSHEACRLRRKEGGGP